MPFSFTISFAPCVSMTAPQGSCTSAASTCFAANAAGMFAGSIGTMLTVPPSSVAFRPFSCSRCRRLMSCVLPRVGTATFFPLRPLTFRTPLSLRATSTAPAFAAPAYTWMGTPRMKAFMAGPGPTYAASMAPAAKASLIWLPLANSLTTSFTPSGRFFWIRPRCTPTSPAAWVTFGKTPRRSSFACCALALAIRLRVRRGSRARVISPQDTRPVE